MLQLCGLQWKNIKLKNSCIVIINEYKGTRRRNKMKNVFSLATRKEGMKKIQENCHKNERKKYL